MKLNHILITAFMAVIFLLACRKTPVNPGTNPPSNPPSTANELQLIADSVYLFSREIYFWNEIRTATYDSNNFKPRDAVQTDAVITAKAAIAKVRNTNALDKAKEFSYATKYDESTASTSVAPSIDDYGFYYKAGYSNRQIYPEDTLGAGAHYFKGFYVSYVYKSSDAGKKGVQRGFKFISVNGTDMTKINETSVGILNKLFYEESLKSADFVFQKPDGQTLPPMNLSITTFVPNSVLYREKIVSNTGRNIGYLVYNFFGKYADTKADIDEAIQYFKNQGINEIVLDLRYNRGGYTHTQDYLANNFAPVSANGNVMYKMHYNANLQAGNYTLMKTRHAYDKGYYSVARNTHNFSVINNFNATKIYVIVSHATASASELFCNSLKPYYNDNIILIGDQTYGKPVGFFPIDLFKKTTFWTVSFETRNKNDGAVPYSGFGPNFRVYDGVDKNWGDRTEDCLTAAINLIDGMQPTTSAVITVPRSTYQKTYETKRKEIFEHSNMLYR